MTSFDVKPILQIVQRMPLALPAGMPIATKSRRTLGVVHDNENDYSSSSNKNTDTGDEWKSVQEIHFW